MKYLSIPVHLIRFWYPESLVVFLRVWRNSLQYLEEDLAVGLMFKLLFAPLFHDSTITGRMLSFFFRGSRIVMGGFAFIFTTIFIFIVGLYWFLLPVLVFFLKDYLALLSQGLIFSGVVLFVNHLLSHPHKKIWQVKKVEGVWQASFVKRSDLKAEKLLKSEGVKNLALYLEQTLEGLNKLSLQCPEKEVLQKVWELGRNLKVPYLKPEHFFVATLMSTPGIEGQLEKLGLQVEDFVDTVDFFQRRTREWRMVPLWDEDFRVKHLRGVNRGWLGVPTPGLDSVSEDLTRKAAGEYIPDFVGRTHEVAQVMSILSMEKGRNVVLVGEPGAGRSALVNYLAKVIVSGDAPQALATKRLMRLDLTKLLTGVQTQGELAAKVKEVFEEASFSGNIIVFVDEIQDMGIGEAATSFNLYSLMLPYIESEDFQFLATTEPSNFTRILEKNGALVRLFTKIELPPATEIETVDILKNQAIIHERYRKVKTTLLAIKEMAHLAKEYLHERVMPDAALQVFEECLAVAQDGWINRPVVEKVVKERVNVPIGEVEGQQKTQLLNLERIIHQTMVDQVEAVEAVAKALRRSAAQLRDKNRPIGSFLFVGPTGVGKTELAKILAQTYFQGRGNFYRLDMSEYQTAEAISRLIGDTNNEGLLTQEVRNKPYTLILLDEFEKADSKILTLFLQVLDDGRLTSGSGRTVDFTNTIIIATSNAASLTIAKGLGTGMSYEALKKQVSGELLTIFKPELINRFDDVVLFKPLSPSDLQQVVQIKLAGLQKQLKEQGFEVDFDSGLIQALAQKGYDPVLGARPLRRLIQDTLEARLSVMILENKLPKGEKFIASQQLLNS
ncbi:MAG: ATP-dependent Clp protease ATP-binding subunit [bacterium]|nr:ATP-dependent Clp protease ATP-binding subunit [bacterium]